MPKTCPECGKNASGKYCAHCGAALEAPGTCAACGNTIPQDGKFCNMCGVPVGSGRPVPTAAGTGARTGSTPRLPWVIAGVAIAVLVLALVIPRLMPSEDGVAPPVTASAPTAAPALDPSAVDLSQLTPREAADRLFNRVMQNVSAGDTAQALAFAPMAIAAYGLVESIDPDGLYHLAVLQLVSGDAAAARASADSILATVPNHLFGLFTAAQAEEIMGNSDAAGDLYQRFLDNYDAEMATQRIEYSDHAAVLPSMVEEAEQRASGS